MVRPDGELEREADRKLGELLQELRLVLPGTTVLFAFLLALPVSSRFDRFSSLDRAIFFVAFVSSATALVFLLGEAGYHRLRGHPYDKQLMVRTVSRQAIVGLVMLGVSMVACLALVCDLVYGGWTSVAFTVALTVLIVLVWFVLPLLRRALHDHTTAQRLVEQARERHERRDGADR